MKLINPLGRKPGDGVKPLSCMCSNTYATTRGEDRCFKCGCSCSSPKHSAANSSEAFWTVRGSGDIE
ncbi:Apre_1838 family putative sactipeptide bacteriocin [Peptoniphilus lacrimalis]|uniref:Putative bacteriocin, CLOSPO_01332 family n=1 Tax=Peptoniphilus lacrimalis TaxID=33031 RepID=A0A379C491_9FIRM|nr:Apre_1838 family putative sactipeptide bacteriocin [Peptoniphilus lacrimalis]SUB56908.1 putative bacteriocin precursor, CLOSPO_01332 family [Peptoniphilus lacrimalis]